MRLDKYLWCVRKYKTRTLATEAVKKERVQINGELSKPSREVRTGDLIEYSKEGISYRLAVKDIPKSRVGARLVAEYIEDKTPAEELEKKEFIQMMRSLNRQKGTGRPTKKDRRNLDDFKES